MPAAAKIPFIGLVLGDDYNFGVARHRLDKIVDIERAETTTKPQMLLRRQVLVAKEDHAMIEECLMEVGRYIDTFDHGAQRATNGLSINRPIDHFQAPKFPTSPCRPTPDETSVGT